MRTRESGWKRKRATLAARTRHHGPDDPEAVALAQEFALDNLADHIRRVVDNAPAPTPDQIERLRGLLPPIALRTHADAELAAGGGDADSGRLVRESRGV